MEDLKENALKIYEAIFNGQKLVEIDGVEYPIRSFSRAIRYIDLFGLRFIEQNRAKPSEWGKKAREGHKILWVIKGRQYLARVVDGTYADLKKPLK